MTTLMERPTDSGYAWNVMPGWGVVADLTPPELLAMRRLVSLRKMIAAALVLVLVACVAGYVYAMMQQSSAQDDVDAANNRTTTLLARQHKYASVTQLEGATKAVNAQIATLMKTDVDVATLIMRMRAVLPGSMSLTSMNVQMNQTNQGSTDTTNSLNTSGHTVIGKVTLAGQSRRIIDLAAFVVELAALPGVVDVIPNSNDRGAGKTSGWNVTLNLTDQLHTHRYDAKAATGGTR